MLREGWSLVGGRGSSPPEVGYGVASRRSGFNAEEAEVAEDAEHRVKGAHPEPNFRGTAFQLGGDRTLA